VMVISVNGSIDAVTAPQLENYIRDKINAGYIKLVLDFGEVDYSSSAGLRMLLGAVKETRNKGGDLHLANVSAELSKFLKMSGFSNIARVFEDIKSAVGSYSESIENP